jgi:Uma2 family endonuclease
MTAVLEEPVAITLTAEEYAQLPPSSRMELVDGVLMIAETPTGQHQDVVDLLKWQLTAVCPKDLRIVREQGARLGEVLRRNPDLMAIRAGAYNPHGCSYAPADIVLAVEVVSPGSRTRDRLHKPAEYAEEGIGHYWRVETSPGVAVHTYRLGETGSYLETGLFIPGDTTTAPGLPWARVEVATIEPKLTSIRCRRSVGRSGTERNSRDHARNGLVRGRSVA